MSQDKLGSSVKTNDPIFRLSTPKACFSCLPHLAHSSAGALHPTSPSGLQADDSFTVLQQHLWPLGHHILKKKELGSRRLTSLLQPGSDICHSAHRPQAKTSPTELPSCIKAGNVERLMNSSHFVWKIREIQRQEAFGTQM